MRSIFETLLQLLLVLAAFVLSCLISLGTTYDLSQISTVGFWLESASSAVIMLITYNLVYSMDQNNRARNVKSRYYLAFQTNKIRMNRIHSEKLYDELDRAIKEENKERYINKCNSLIHNITARIAYDDLMNCEDSKAVNILADKYLLNDKQKKKLQRLYLHIRSGKIKIKEVVAERLLQDKELTNIEIDLLDYSEKSVEIKRNVKKIISFVIITMFFSIIDPGLGTVPFWKAFVKNITMFSSSSVSGFISSRGKTNFKTRIYENRNAFFERRLGLSDKFEF